MTKLLRILSWLVLLAVPATAQLTTHVTATVKDTNGSLYVNCSWSVVFVGQNTTPGAGPYAPASLLNGQQGTCDSFGVLTVDLADNINVVTPTPSQWSFAICSALGYVGAPYCKTNILITITGATQSLTSILTPQMPILPIPPSGTGGPVVFTGIPFGPCTNSQTAVNALTGDFYSCSIGAWLKVGPIASAANPGGSPFSVQTNVGGVGFGGISLGTGQNIVGTSTAAIAQTKPLIDVRDQAADCTGVTASDTAITNSIAAGPHILLPQNCIIRLSSNHTYAVPTVFEFKQGARIKPDAGVVITMANPPVAGPMQQIFDISNSGSWIIPSTGDVYIPWYGTDCTETTDASTILNVMTGTQDRFSGRTLVGPDNCHLVVESSWIIKNQESLTLRANKVPGLNLAFSVSGRTSGTIILPINKDVGIPLSRAGWSVTSDSFNSETPVSDGFPAMPASNLLTVPPGTSCTPSNCKIWITCYIAADCHTPGVADPLPHYVRVDMGSAQTIAQVALGTRKESALGRPLTYDIQTSTSASCASGVGFSSQTTGTWDGSPADKVANFTPVSARCFEVIGNTSISGVYMAANSINASTAAPTPWTATADSVESGHPASFLIDGVYDDPTVYDRYWSTAFSGSPGLPHYVIIDMQVAQTVAGLAFTPRQASATNGFILGYEVDTSTNASCASNVGFSSQTTGTWNWDFTTKTATWAPVSARCVKLIAITSSGGNTADGQSLQIYGATGVPQADAGPIILLSRSGFNLMKGFTVQAQANGVSSNFTGSIQTINYPHGTLSGGYTSTHNTFEDLYLTPNLQGLSVNNYKGMYIHNDPNQELFTFKNMQVSCNNGYFSYGFLSDNPNADSNYFQNSIINNCMRGIGMIAGISYIHGGNYSTNGGFTSYGSGGAVIYELGSGCVTEMSNTVEAEGTGQILNTGKDLIGGGCNNSVQNFHDNQLTTPDLDPAVYPINFTGGGGLTLKNNNMASTPSTVHNSQLVGSDQTALFGTFGRLTDDGNNTMTAPNVLVKVPTGGKGFNIPRLSVSTVADQGYTSFPLQFLPAIGPANGARATSSPWIDFSGNVFNSIPSTPQQETFTMRAALAADGVHSTFSFTEKGVTGTVGGAHQYAFDAPLSGVQLSAVTQPAMDALTVLGTPGATSYGYKIECLAGAGHCAASSQTTTAVGPAILGTPANSCILINWRPAGSGGNVGAGAWGYKLFRTTCGGAGVCSTNPTGVVYTATNRDIDSGGNYGFTDCGTAGDGATPDGINTTGQLVSTVTTGLPPLVITSTDNVPNLNASLLLDNTWAAPGPIGGTTPGAGTFTSVTTSGAVPGNVAISEPFGSIETYTSGVCETAGTPTTLNTGATTTDTGLSCLPATAIIDSVVYRITTTITTSANFTIGDATIAARFCGTQSTLTSGTTGVCFLQSDQTGTSGPRQVSAAKIRVTLNANPGAGAIRLMVFYHTWSAPTS